VLAWVEVPDRAFRRGAVEVRHSGDLGKGTALELLKDRLAMESFVVIAGPRQGRRGKRVRIK
jgi:hypothetical protein